MEAILLIAAGLYVIWYILKPNFGRVQPVLQVTPRTVPSQVPQARPASLHPGQISDDDEDADESLGQHGGQPPRSRLDGPMPSISTRQGDHSI